MQLWLIVVLIVIVCAVIYLSKMVPAGDYDFVTPFFRLGILGIATIICLVLYIGHLKGCLNHSIGIPTISKDLELKSQK